jgi:energy-coupling factor transport system ATP-binding protein
MLVMSRGSLVLDGTPRQVFCARRELRGIGVDSPRVARVYNSLAKDGLVEGGEPCLTVSEAAERLVAGLVGDSPRGR